MSNENWPTPPLGGDVPTPGTGGAPLGDWQAPRMGEDAPEDAGKKKKKRRKKKSKKGSTGDGETTRGVANRRRIAAIGLAVLTGGLLFLGSGAEEVEGTFVVRAERPIGANTTVNPEMFVAEQLPVELIEQGAYVGTTAEEAIAAAMIEIDGLQTQYPVSAGEQIHVEDFKLEAKLAPDLGPDERLISLSASIAGAVGGDLRVGDSVDVIGVGDQSARLMVNNAVVVDITLPEQQFGSFANAQAGEDGRDTSREDLLPGDPIPGVYTLRVKAVDAPRLLTVASLGQVLLVYRAPGADDLEAQTLPLDLLLCGLDQPGLTAEDLERLPDSCRDSDGEVSYPDSFGGVSSDSAGDEEFPLGEDLPDEGVSASDDSEASQTEG